jgi:uncharacterized BrkB/YihY/UPF0761 family membrane protein
MPGTIIAVVTFHYRVLPFSLYLRSAPSFDATYGSLGAIVVLMLLAIPAELDYF